MFRQPSNKAAGFMRCPHAGRHTLKGLLSNCSNYLATLIVYPPNRKMSIGKQWKNILPALERWSLVHRLLQYFGDLRIIRAQGQRAHLAVPPDSHGAALITPAASGSCYPFPLSCSFRAQYTMTSRKCQPSACGAGHSWTRRHFVAE